MSASAINKLTHLHKGKEWCEKAKMDLAANMDFSTRYGHCNGCLWTMHMDVRLPWHPPVFQVIWWESLRTSLNTSSVLREIATASERSYHSRFYSVVFRHGKTEDQLPIEYHFLNWVTDQKRKIGRITDTFTKNHSLQKILNNWCWRSLNK